MKPVLHHLFPLALALFAIALSTGCGGDGGSDVDYSGTWQGTTSHGGTATFTVFADQINALRITDPQANIWITLPVDIDNGSFAVENSENAIAPGSPAVSLQGSFSSETQASGRYAITQSGSTWSGTFTASRL